MDNRNILIIIGIIVLIAAAGIILVMLTSENYERMGIVPNGTSIDVPLNKTTYDGEFQSARVWHWDKGILVTYNSHEDKNILRVSELGIYTLNEIIETGEKQNIDGFTAYVINADEILEIELFDAIKLHYTGKFYCIQLANGTTGDVIIICSNDRDEAVHMAKSVQYKNVFPVNSDFNDTIETVENLSEYLESTVNDYANSTDFDNAISTVENLTGDLESSAKDYVNDANLSDVKTTVEEKTGVNIDDAKSDLEQYIGKLTS